MNAFHHQHACEPFMGFCSGKSSVFLFSFFTISLPLLLASTASGRVEILYKYIRWNASFNSWSAQLWSKVRVRCKKENWVRKKLKEQTNQKELKPRREHNLGFVKISIFEEFRFAWNSLHEDWQKLNSFDSRYVGLQINFPPFYDFPKCVYMKFCDIA